MSLILCIETGTDVCSVGIAKDGELLSLRESDEGRDHARKVGVFVDELLRETGIAPDELDAVAVGKGPGSYTGLRIGVSFAKGLCYGVRKPLNEVSAEVVDGESFAHFRSQGRPFVIFGSGARKCAGILPDAVLVEVAPSARGLARLAQRALDAGCTEDIAYFEPFYLKDFVVTTSKKKLF